MSDVERLNSGSPFERAFGYARVVRSGDQAWTAGCTASADGQVLHVGDAGAQARVAFNVALEALGWVGFEIDDVVQSRMYVRNAEDCEAVGAAHAEVLGHVRPAATMIVVAGFVDPLMLVEIELVAHRASDSDD
jgi:enamine deaminase RidA (YjgF/YER057c/UK114 family)